MRRSIVSISLLLTAAAVAVWALALTGSAGAAPRSARIACPATSPVCCPLPPGAQTAHIICCPPAASGDSRPHVRSVCCGTAPCCTACCPSSGSPTCCASPCGPGSLTITSSPDPSRAGQKVVISGAVVGGAAAGTQVVLWRKLASQSSFKQAGQTTTDSGGQYTFTLSRGTVMADQEWYVTSGGLQSATLQQHVDALVALRPSTRSARVGRAIMLRGHVTPSHAGQMVLIEVSRAGAWHLIARPRLGRGSSYAVSHRFASPGTLELRVVLSGDRRNDRSVSRTVTVSVKP